MTDLPNQAALAFNTLFGMRCQSVSISHYGAIQLGFGEAVDYLIAGKYAKKRYEVEVGTYTSDWKCIDGDDVAEKELSESLIGAKLVSIRAEGGGVVLEIDDGRRISVDPNSSSDDIFYAYFRNSVSVFFNSTTGWSLE